MAYAVRVVCRPELAEGFHLAGVPSEAVRTPSEGVARILELADRADLGVLLVEEDLYDALTDSEKRALERRPVPMIVPFPGPSWEAEPARAEAYVIEILRRAIGYSVRLR